MKVSIVIPAHNEELYIGKAIGAVLAQKYPDFEVIVVDNASTDKTASIAREFPVKVVSEPKKGLLMAKQRGLREVTGDIIANIDADSRPSPDWLARGVAYFKDPGVTGVSGPYYHYDAGRLFNMAALLTQQTIYRFLNWFFQLTWIHKGGVMIGSNTLVRTETIKRAGGYDTNLTFYGEDTNTAKRVAQYGRVIFDPRLIMSTSARRFQKEGFVTIQAKYVYHFFLQIFRGKTN